MEAGMIESNIDNNGKCWCSEEKNIPRKWSELSYAGENRVPAGIEPYAGSWPTYFLKRDEYGNFLNPLTCKPIDFEIAQPNNFNFENQLKIVEQVLQDLTPMQKKIAIYWGTGPATKQWTPIIDRLIDTYGQLDAPQEDPIRAARILAAVQAGINDAFIVAWYFKYLWNIARPNQLDQNLATILCTPKFPAYPSGHAVISGCAQVILSYFFPPEAEKLKELAEEDAISRIYAGVHFPVDGSEGLRLGRQIGRIVVSVLSNQKDITQAMIDPLITKDLHAILPPPPYEQIIPFPRAKACDSLILPCKTKKNKAMDNVNELDDSEEISSFKKHIKKRNQWKN